MKKLLMFMILLLFCSSAASAVGEEGLDPYLAELNLNGNSLLLADHYDDISDGNWIKLSGGDPILLPDPFNFNYTGVNRTEYHSESLDLSLELNLEEAGGRYFKEIGYPYSTHPVYTEAGDKNSVTMDFKGSSAFAGQNVSVYLVRASLSEVLDTFSEVREGNITDYNDLFHTCFEEGDYTNYGSKVLDGNGDLNLGLGTKPAGHYALLVLLDDAGESLVLLSATAFEVTPYEMTLSTPATVEPDSYVDITIAVNGPEPEYTYAGVLINKEDYIAEIGVESNGSRAGTNLSLNGVELASGIDLPSEINSLTDMAGVLDVDTGDLNNLTRDIFGEAAYFKETRANSTTLYFDLGGRAPGNYVLLMGAKSGSGIAGLAQTEFTIGQPPSDPLDIEYYTPENLKPSSRAGQPQEFSVETSDLCTINWYVDGQLVRSTSDSMQDSYTNSTAQPGEHVVTVIASDGEETDQLFWTWTVTIDPIVANFTADVLSGSAPLTVQFTDHSLGDPMPDSWAWDFGDGTQVSDEQSPEHVYTAAGAYTVTLTASNAYDSDDLVKTQCINVIPTYIKAPTGKLFEGDTESFYVEVARIHGAETINFTLGFDNSLVTVDSVTLGEGFDGTLTEVINNPDGTVNVSVNPTAIDVDAYAGLVNITFTAVSDVNFPSRSTPLDITEATLTKEGITVPIDRITDGALTVLTRPGILAPDVTVGAGDRATITVAASDLNNVDRVEFTLKFKKSLVTVESVDLDTSTQGLVLNSSEIKNENGWVTLFIDIPEGITAEGTVPLADIEIQSKGLPGTGQLSFGRCFWSSGDLSGPFTDRTFGTITVTPKPPALTEAKSTRVENATLDETTVQVNTTANGNITVSGDNTTINVRNEGLNISIFSDENGLQDDGSGNWTGNYTSAEIEKPPIETDVGGEISNVTVFFDANVMGALSELMNESACINASVTPGLPEASASNLNATMFSLGLNIEEVAYTMTVHTEGMDRTKVDFTNANITMTLSASYVDSRGGPANFTILSIADDGTVTELETNWEPLANGDYLFRAISPAGFSDKVLAKVSEIGPLAASFTGYPKSGANPLTVQFLDNSTGSPIAWEWDLDGDGNTDDSTEENPTYEYTAPGTYNITLKISNGTTWAETSRFEYITVGSGPDADFIASTEEDDAPLPVQFTDTSTGEISEWLWDFGDGITSNDQNPSHTYTSAGVYDVSLIVTGPYGSDTVEKPAFIHVTASPAPAASFTANKVSGKAPFTVQFTDLSENEPEAWEWDFGDGTPVSNERDPEHTYTKAGTFSVTLNASSRYGYNITTLSGYITVTADSPNGGGGGGSGGGGGGGGGGSPEDPKNVRTKELAQQFVTNGNHVRFEFARKATSIDYVEFDAMRSAGKITTIVEELKGKSTLTPTEPDGEIYQHLNIWVGNSGFATPGNIANCVVGFRVNKTWITENEIIESTVTLNRYSEEKWNAFEAVRVSEDEEFVYFVARVPGFSPFAITADSKAVIESGEETRPAEETEQPGKAGTDQEPEATPGGEESKSGISKGMSFLLGFIIVILIGIAVIKKKEQ